MSRYVNSISGRLSLRMPQRRSLEILHRVMEIAQPQGHGNTAEVLKVIQSEFPTVQDFERTFPSLCFALATGVGKTRLMGAFIAYLHLEHGIRHFFVLAPNLTIYRKLITDFTPNTAKYVFQGIAEFSTQPPSIVTADNYEHRHQVIATTIQEAVEINVFNIAKFNTRTTDARKLRRLSEFLGESYYEYLSRLGDLVLLMDEAHRYRADSSMRTIEGLNPILGIELTATPQIEKGSRSARFTNVIFDYPLSAAMRDGYVKDPAVATRPNFDPSTMTKEALERIKLEDGIRVHETVKVELEVYAQQNGVRRVKPFMLVIASDTQHADELVGLIQSDSFFEGRYGGRVIQIHSGQKGSERDDNVERLLAVERADEPTEIVVHVNMLKEGWDVTNLYTIVPLRAADSRTLVEQSIGRGLRLPYGRRTGVHAVDRLTIVAHDRFQDIVDEARRGGYSFSVVTIGDEVPETPKQTVYVAPVFEAMLGIARAAQASEAGETTDAGTRPVDGEITEPEARFKTADEQAVAALALEAIRRVARDPHNVPGTKALQSDQVQRRLLEEVMDGLHSGSNTMQQSMNQDSIIDVVRETTAVYVTHTIAIPRVIVLPKGVVRAGFNAFKLELSAVRLQPVPREILIQHLASDTREVIGAIEGDHEEQRLEDYIVRGLIDFDDVSYDEQADLLYDLASQFIAHLEGYLKDSDEVRSVLLFHQRQISNLIHAQMRQHAWEKASTYEAVVSQGFSEIRSQAFAAAADETVRSFDAPIDNKLDIRRMLFGGFRKCLYPTQKFDTDSERRFAVVLESDSSVVRWFKPGKGVFQIRYASDHYYEPDFVVETETEKLLCEPKRANQLQDANVVAKARAAAIWCKHASGYEAENGGKRWRYVLIPHDRIADNMTVDGLATSYTVEAPQEGD